MSFGLGMSSPDLSLKSVVKYKCSTGPQQSLLWIGSAHSTRRRLPRAGRCTTAGASFQGWDRCLLKLVRGGVRSRMVQGEWALHLTGPGPVLRAENDRFQAT